MNLHGGEAFKNTFRNNETNLSSNISLLPNLKIYKTSVGIMCFFDDTFYEVHCAENYRLFFISLAQSINRLEILSESQFSNSSSCVQKRRKTSWNICLLDALGFELHYV